MLSSSPLTADEHDQSGQEQLRAVAGRLGISFQEIVHPEREVIASGSGGQAHIVITRAGVRQLVGHSQDILGIWPDLL